MRAGTLWLLFRNNLQRIFVLIFLAACLTGSFAERFLMYSVGKPYAVLWHQRLELYGWSLPIAKGFGQANKVIFAFILLPVSRNAITFLRATPLGLLIPFDDAITFHRMLGVLGLISISGHTLAHIINMVHEVFLTGIIMWACVIAAYPFAIKWPCSRFSALAKTKLGRMLNNHNWFYATHHLFVGFYIALLLHPRPALPHESTEWLVSDTWVWVGLPIIIYVAERMTRGYRRRSWRTQIYSARILACNVLELSLSTPRGFVYRPGQYIMVRCPAVSLFEWHPFSLTSAPANAFLSVHIRAAGDWSTDLLEVFAKTVRVGEAFAIGENAEAAQLDQSEEPLSNNSEPTLAQTSLPKESHSVRIPSELPKYPQVIIDGPYGAPTQRFENYQTLLLIGAGIGVTPMASVLKHLVSIWKLPQTTKQGEVKFRRKVYFYWTVRDAAASEWFKEVLEEISQDDKDSLIEAKVFITGPVEECPGTNTVHVGSSFMRYQSSRSGSCKQLVQRGSRITLTIGRINWEAVFSDIQSRHPKTTVGVFFCGSPALGSMLKSLSAKQSVFGGTVFKFHREAF